MNSEFDKCLDNLEAKYGRDEDIDRLRQMWRSNEYQLNYFRSKTLDEVSTLTQLKTSIDNALYEVHSNLLDLTDKTTTYVESIR